MDLVLFDAIPTRWVSKHNSVGLILLQRRNSDAVATKPARQFIKMDRLIPVSTHLSFHSTVPLSLKVTQVIQYKYLSLNYNHQHDSIYWHCPFLRFLPPHLTRSWDPPRSQVREAKTTCSGFLFLDEKTKTTFYLSFAHDRFSYVWKTAFSFNSNTQCSGSTCFWASRIRIHLSKVWIRIRILLSASKNSKKNLDSYCFVTSFGTFYLWKMM